MHLLSLFLHWRHILLTTLRRIFNKHPYRIAMAFFWLLLVFSIPNSIQIIFDYFGFLFLGITGAIFANSTGAGGGVVFVPFFNQLEMQNTAIIATSFAIQCCGMTAGAVTWYQHYKSAVKDSIKDDVKDLAHPSKLKEAAQWDYLPKGLAITVPFSILGIWFAQFLLTAYTEQMQSELHIGFGIFSILLAIAIYASIPLLYRQKSTTKLQAFDYVVLAIIAFLGGIITAWLSVGVGELVAVYLILRGFNITSAIALAVILSAFTVWSAIFQHVVVTQAIYWQVLLYAGAGAIIGGIVAKRIVLYFSIVKLKIFFATWVLIMGTVGLIT
ncbi:MAG: putative membrane protein YfcA [Glaciecola sp.]